MMYKKRQFNLEGAILMTVKAEILVGKVPQNQHINLPLAGTSTGCGTLSLLRAGLGRQGSHSYYNNHEGKEQRAK